MSQGIPVYVESTVVETDEGDKPGWVGVCDRCDHECTVVGEGEEHIRTLIDRFEDTCPCGGDQDYYPVDESGED